MALCLFIALGAPAAFAQSCTVTTPTGSYGAVNILSGSTSPTTASFTVSCTGTANRTVRLCIDLSYGANFGGGTTQRSMIGPSAGLNHELYTDPAHTSVWGSWGVSIFGVYGTAGKQVDLALGATGSATTAAQIIYGQVLGAQQSVPPGSYSWATSTPGVTYDYSTATACPTGTKTVYNAGSTDIWTATVNSNCLVSATALDFGSQGILAAAVDAANTLSVQCTNATPYQVALGVGNGTGATVATRKMTKGAETVAYTLYRDAARTTLWGQTNGTDTASGTGTGFVQNLSVYGRVFAQATPSPGAYTDTIVVTVTY